MIVYRHPTDLRRTVERERRDRELEHYGWTADGGTPADEPARPARRTRSSKAAPIRQSADKAATSKGDGKGDDGEGADSDEE